jgi:SAM-dependent methyltransferase
MKQWGTNSDGNPCIKHDSRLDDPANSGRIQEILLENHMHEAKMAEELRFWRACYAERGLERFLESRQAGYENLCKHLPRMTIQQGEGLDVGCGMVSIYEYGDPLQSVTAIDPLLPWYTTICAKPQSRVNYTTSYMDDGQIPFDDNAFDFVSCINVIDHTAFHREIIAGIDRVLKPGGLLYLNVNFDPVLTLPHHIKLWNRAVVEEELHMFKRLDEHIRWTDKHNKDYYWGVFRSQK